MKLIINYDNVEYLDLFKKEYNKEKKREKKRIIKIVIFFMFCVGFGFWCVSYFISQQNLLRIPLILLSYLLMLICIRIALPQNNFYPCNLMSQSVYEKSLYSLSEWKRKLANKQDNEIFTKMDNGEIFVFDGNDYVSLKLLLKDFNYDGPVPETFDTLTITGKDGEVKVEFA